MLQTILAYLWDRRTTVLGYVVTALGIMATSELFTATQVKWFLLINGILTAILGHYNNRQVVAGNTPDIGQRGRAHPVLLMFMATLMALWLSACATLFLPKSFTSQVAEAYAGVAMTNDTVLVLYNAGTIDKARASSVALQVRSVREAIDLANGLGPDFGKDKLGSALALLELAKQELCRDQKENPNCTLLLGEAK